MIAVRASVSFSWRRLSSWRGCGILSCIFEEEFEENFFSGGGAEFMVLHSDEVEKLSSGGEGVI